MDKAIPLISIVDDKYVLEPQAVQFLMKIPKPIAVVCVAGMYRTGKSYLLNRMILNRDEGFGISPTIHSCTKGLWIWGNTLHGTTPQGTPINILVIDSEGMGSFEENSEHDMKIFTLAVLLSSCLIYNSVSCLDQTAIMNLGLVVGLSRKIQLSSEQNEENLEDLKLFFPSFMWVLRDFCLLLQNSKGDEITPREYLENSLKQQKGFSEQVEERNRIRSLITTLFQQRDCFTFSRPSTIDSNRSIDQMKIDELRSDFVNQIMTFRKRILRNIKAKKIGDSDINGQMYVNLITSYIKAINGQEIIKIKTVWQYVAARHSQTIMKSCQQKIEQQISQIKPKLPVGVEQLSQVLKQTKEQILKTLKKQSMPQNYELDLLKIKQIFKSYKRKIVQQNNQQMHRAIYTMLDKKAVLIRQRIQSSHYSAFEDSYRQITTLQSPELKHIPLQLQRKLTYQSAQHYLSQLKSKINLHSIEKDELKQLHCNYVERLKQQLKGQQKKHEDDLLKLQTKNTSLQCEMEKVKVTLELCEKQRKQLLQVKKKYINQTQAKYIIKLEDMRQREKEATEAFQKIKKQMMIKENEYQTEKLLLEQKVVFTDKMLKQANVRILDYENKLSALSVSKKQQLKEYQNITEKEMKSQMEQITQLRDSLRQKDIEIKLLNETVQNIRSLQSMKLKKVEDQLSQQRSMKRNEHSLASQVQMWKLKEKIARQEVMTYKNKYQVLENNRNKGAEELRVERNTFERQNAVLCQQIEFTKTELKDLREKYLELSHSKSQFIQVSQPSAPSINIDEIHENHRNQIRQIQQKHRAAIKKISEELQTFRKQKNQIELSLTLAKKESSETIKQLQVYVQNSKGVIQELESKINSSDSNKEAFMGKYKEYYEGKIKKLEDQVEMLRNKCSQNKPSDDFEKEVLQIKNYHEQQKMFLEKKLLEEKQKSAKALKQNLQSLKKQHQLELQQLEENQQMIQFQFKEMEETCSQKITELEKQNQLQQLQITNRHEKIQQLQQQLKQLKDSLSSDAQRREQELKDTIRQLWDKNEKFKIDISSYESAQMNFKQTITALQSQISQLTSNMSTQSTKYQSDITHLNEALAASKSKYQQFYDQSFTKLTQLQKSFALSQQSNRFNEGKIVQLQNSLKHQRKNLESRVEQVRKELEAENKQKIDELTADLDKLSAKYTQTKKLAKDTEATLHKQLNQAKGLAQVYTEKSRQLQLKVIELERLNAQQQQKFRQSLIQVRNQTLDQRQKYVAEMHRLEDSILQIQTDKANIEGNYEKDKILWSSKMSFLEQQKQQLKQDCIEKVKRLEDTIEFLQRSKPDRGLLNLPQAFSSIERNYQLKLIEANDAFLKKQLQLVEKVRSLETQLKLQQEKNIKQALKGSSEGLERALYQSRESQKRLTQEIERLRQQKQQLRIDHQKALLSQRQQAKNKLKELEQKNRDIENKRSMMLFDHEREAAKWRQQKQTLKESNKELEEQLTGLKTNNRKLEKQNEDFRIDRKKGKLTNSLGNSMMRSQFKFDRFKGQTYKNYSIFGSPANHSEYSQGGSQAEKQQSVKIDEEE